MTVLSSSQQRNGNSNWLDTGKSSKKSGIGDLGDSEDGLAISSVSIDAREFLKDLRRKAQESLLELTPHGGSDERDVEYG